MLHVKCSKNDQSSTLTNGYLWRICDEGFVKTKMNTIKP